MLLPPDILLIRSLQSQAPATVVSSGSFSGSISKVEDHWNPGLGCYWRVYGTVFKSGSGVPGNALVYVQLIDTASGNIRDSKTLAVGNLAKGESRSFEVALDGECDHSYRVEVRPVEGT